MDYYLSIPLNVIIYWMKDSSVNDRWRRDENVASIVVDTAARGRFGRKPRLRTVRFLHPFLCGRAFAAFLLSHMDSQTCLPISHFSMLQEVIEAGCNAICRSLSYHVRI